MNEFTGNTEQGNENNGFQQQCNNGPQNQRGPQGATGKTVAALILGITAIMLALSVVLAPAGLICGIIGLIMIIKERKLNPCPMATAAFVVSIIGLALGVLNSVACVACVGLFSYFSCFDSGFPFDGNLESFIYY